MTLLLLLGFFLVLVTTLYFTPKFYNWSGITLVYLVLTFHSHNSLRYSTLWTILALLYIILNIFILVKPFRRRLTKGIYLKTREILPKISETEKLALNAGNSWFEQDIFCGSPNFNKLHGYRKFTLSEEEQRFFDNETEELCRMVDNWSTNYKKHDFSIETWNYMRNKGFFGLVIEKKYGGKGFSATAHSDIVAKIGTKNPALAVTVMVPNSLGPGELLHNYGTDEQKNYYLPRLANGTDIPCFALTSPTAGSDATSIIDEGVVCEYEKDGQKILGVRLQNVEKRYITLAPVATLVGLAFKLKDPDGLLNGIGREGITCALLDRGLDGLEIGNRLIPNNLYFMNGTIRIKEAFIPISSIIGGQSMAGEGWRMLVECLSIGRSISLPACGTAQAVFSTVITSAYAQIREQFHSSIGSFEGVEEVLARMGGLSYIANATRKFTIEALENNIRPSVASAIAKYHLTEIGRSVTLDAMDIHGGRSVIMGPNNYMSIIYDSLPISITVEGANIMTRNLLIYGQGIMKCHPYLLKEYEALASENGFNDFDNALFSHFGYFLRNKVRAIIIAFTGGVFTKSYRSKFSHYYKGINRISSALAYTNDIILVMFGGEIKRKERISARLGDVMSYLYMASATLKYFKDNGELKSDEVFVSWSLEHLLFKAQNALIDVFDNIPNSSIGQTLKIILFPFGRTFKEPSDKLSHLISQNLMYNSETRKLWKNMSFVPENDLNDPVGRMEAAFMGALLAKPIRNKILDAIKNGLMHQHSDWEKMADIAYEKNIIVEEEFNNLKNSLLQTHNVIQVDEFLASDLGPNNAHPDWNNIN